LQTYIQRREDSDATPSQNRTADVLLGSVVDQRYTVVSLVSTRGGIADVYAAASDPSRASDPDVALKVLRHGQLSVLEREVEILQRFRSPGIVSFLGSGRLDDGRVYLAMEYLKGSTLREYCESATRPSEARMLEWAAALLDALIVIHPRERQLRSLRASATTGDDLQELLEARYGYVHRDIKPENIVITSRGPVLIDFNISSRVSDPVATISATPGYLPVELLGPEWSPRIDLFQLGVTLLQVAAGDKLLADNRNDLVLIMRASISDRAAQLIEKLIDTSESGYHTAFTARRDLARLLSKR
jgi:serine/threonine-protein kinase